MHPGRFPRRLRPGPLTAFPPPGGFSPAAPASPGQFPQVHDGEYMPELAGPGGPPKWNFVRLGFLLVFIGACVMAGAYALCFIGYLLLTIFVIPVLTGG